LSLFHSSEWQQRDKITARENQKRKRKKRFHTPRKSTRLLKSEWHLNGEEDKSRKEGYGHRPFFLNQDASLLGGRGLLGDLLVDLPDEIKEDVIDVNLLPGRSLQEGDTSPAGGKSGSLILSNHAVVLKITLVSAKDHGNLVGILHTEDLLAEVGEIVEGGLGGNGVDEDESLPVLHVEVAHGGKLLGTGSIENLEHALISIDLHLLPVRVLDGGIVFFDEDGLDELNGLKFQIKIKIKIKRVG